MRMRWLVLAAAVLLAGVIGATAAMAPGPAALACPGCFGFSREGAGVFVDRAANAGARRRAGEAVALGRERVADFYGSAVGRPRVLVCLSDACFRRLHGGSARGMALGRFGLILAPGGANVVIAAHELSHIELKTRLVRGASVPSWFNEGLAVVISDDRRYLAPPGPNGRCRVSRPVGPMPAKLGEWVRRAPAENLYAKAACKVDDWLGGLGGARVLGLLAKVNAGRPFEAAFDASSE